MVSHKFKESSKSKFGRCTNKERDSCTCCDDDGKRLCKAFKAIMDRAIAMKRSPVSETRQAKSDDRYFTLRPHQGQRAYLGPGLDGVMHTYEYLVSWVKAGANGSFLAERKASQHARTRNIKTKTWYDHIKKLEAMRLIRVVDRTHVARPHIGQEKAYIVLPHPAWLVKLHEVQHKLGQLGATQHRQQIKKLQARQDAIIKKVQQLIDG